MEAPPARPPATTVAGRFGAFVAERFPFAVDLAMEALAAARGEGGEPDGDPAVLTSLRPRLGAALAERVDPAALPELPDATPGVTVAERLAGAAAELADACDGFLAREAVAASLTPEERRELLWGMVLTRAVDNRLKAFFTGGEVRWRGRPFQGKGFRSLGQEAIYAAPLRLRRGDGCRGPDGAWRGDVVAPLIRDVGAALAMRPEPAMVRQVLNAQMGKAGPPMEGRDLHIGDLSWGVLPPAAPLAISAATAAGLALAFARRGRPGDYQVAVSFIGEGGTSLGEWHEAVNLCAARRLPAVFCVQNNQTALSTPVAEQSAARVFADKATGYGIPGVTLDGTDPEAIAAAFAWAAERAREGRGPSLVELVCLRMCGHAHHDDMLYLGREPQPSWDYPELLEAGYADPGAWAFWAPRDPIPRYAERLAEAGVLAAGELARFREEAEALVEAEARVVVAAPWPRPEEAGRGVYREGPEARHVEVLEDRPPPRLERAPALPPLEPGLPFDRAGRTFLEAVMLGVGDALAADPRAFVLGEDVGGRYGNAFLLLRPLLAEHGERLLNAPLSEAGILGACVGAALAGDRPIAEMQFNDFVAAGFDQLVNNAAKVHYRWGASVPMVVRMPWGGLRHAGPYHSQNTEAWFYRTPGLKVVAPSTPEDVVGLMAASIRDPDPVIFFEHKSLMASKATIPDGEIVHELGTANVVREGSDATIAALALMVPRALEAADLLNSDGISVEVIDLRSLVPLDTRTILGSVTKTGRFFTVEENPRLCGWGAELVSIVGEEAFWDLDGPNLRITTPHIPLPSAAALEDLAIPSVDRIYETVRKSMDGGS